MTENKKNTINSLSVSYKDFNNNEIKLTPEIIKSYLTTNKNVSNQELIMFLKLCEHQKLNPFLKEVYLIKYNDSAANFVVGKEVFLKRANKNDNFLGYDAGVLTVNKKTGLINKALGCVYNKNTDELLGAYATVYRKNKEKPLHIEVMLSEYQAKKSNGMVTNMWMTKEATMIRKVALVQALREAFPDNFGGMYSEEEVINEFDDIKKTAYKEPDRIDVSNITNKISKIEKQKESHPAEQQSGTAEHSEKHNKSHPAGQQYIFNAIELINASKSNDELKIIWKNILQDKKASKINNVLFVDLLAAKDKMKEKLLSESEDIVSKEVIYVNN